MTATIQQQAFGKGMAQAVTRDKGRIKTPLILKHNLEHDSLEGVFRELQVYLQRHPGVSLVPGVVPAESQPSVQDLTAERDALLQQIHQLEAAMAAQEPVTPSPALDDGLQWVAPKDAARILGKSYSTINRACHSGDIQAKVVGGGSIKNGWLCVAATYKGKGASV